MFSKETFTFDDFLLVPEHAYTDVRESESVTNQCFFNYKLTLPIISTPMDTITEIPMMKAMWENGAVGVHHRYCDFAMLKKATSCIGGIAISPSMGIEKIAELYNFTNNFFVIDVAHGHSQKVLDFCQELIKNGIVNIVSGSIVTREAAHAYLRIGIKNLRIGVGGGSRCLTRVVTGFGYPQASAVYNIWQEFKDDAILISDGGCKNTGDIIKAYSVGADFVMTGYLLAGTDECPKPKSGEYIYRGMASEDALASRKKEFFVEGDSAYVKPKGSVSRILIEIEDAIKHACHYGGVTHYKQLTEVEKIRITNNSYLEGMTRK
jgi:IMP dehydrogenase